MYKLIASDLDETLLDDNHQICDANIKAIKKAIEAGVYFVPATGRGYTSITDVLTTLGLVNQKAEYTISFNGAALTENADNRLLHFEGLPFSTAEDLFTFGLKKDVCIHVYTVDMIYIYNFNVAERKRMGNSQLCFTEISEPSIEFLRDIPISKMIFQNMDVPYLMSFEEEMTGITGHTVNISYSSNRYMELNKIGVSKGITLLKLGEILGIKPSEIIAVGDNVNDLSMLEVAGLSVAAANAVESVKTVCDYVCENDNNEGVLAEVIEKFIFTNSKE